jgi:hypothetical protein
VLFPGGLFRADRARLGKRASGDARGFEWPACTLLRGGEAHSRRAPSLPTRIPFAHVPANPLARPGGRGREHACLRAAGWFEHAARRERGRLEAQPPSAGMGAGDMADSEVQVGHARYAPASDSDGAADDDSVAQSRKACGRGWAAGSTHPAGEGASRMKSGGPCLLLWRVGYSDALDCFRCIPAATIRSVQTMTRT